MNWHLRNHLNPILFLLTILISVLPHDLKVEVISTHTHWSNQLLKNYEDSQLRQMFQLFPLLRLLVVVMGVLMLNLLILLNPLVFLLLLTLCLPLLAQKNLKVSGKFWSNNLRTDIMI